MKKALKYVLLLCFSSISILPLLGQIEYDENSADWIRANSIAYLVDQNGDLNFDQVKSLEFDEKDDDFLKYLKKFNRKRVFWIKLELEYLDSTSTQFALQIPFYTKVSAFKPTGSDFDSSAIGISHFETYLNGKWNTRLLLLPKYESKKPWPIYLRIKHESNIISVGLAKFYLAPIQVYKESYQNDLGDDTEQSYLYIFFCGFLLFQFVYVLLQWYLVRRRVYINYAAYILCVLVYYYARFSVFFNQDPGLSLITFDQMLLINNTLLILPTFFYFRFSRYFADMKTSDPYLDRLLQRYEYFLLIAIVIELAFRFIPNDFPKYIPLTIILISQLPFAIYGMIRLARQRRAIAWFLIAGSAIALLSHIAANAISFFSLYMVITVAPLTITLIGLLCEIAIFNTGLLFKARESEIQKIIAQQAVIDEVKSKHELQQQFDSVRNKLASDLHDDIGSSLSSIRIYSYAAKQKLDTDDAAQTAILLDKIERSSEVMMNNMSDMVWAMNVENDNNQNLIDRIQSFAFEIFSVSETDFQIEVTTAFFEMQLNQAIRKNILLIFKEAINNAAKYAKASKVRLIINENLSGGFDFSIKDNGEGLPNPLPNGNGMRTMRNRSKELFSDLIIDSNSSGTSISFTLNRLLPT